MCGRKSSTADGCRPVGCRKIRSNRAPIRPIRRYSERRQRDPSSWPFRAPARKKIRNPCRRIPRAGALVRGVVDAGNAKIGLAASLGVAIQQHVLGAAVAGNTEVARLLASSLVRGSVGKGTVGHRHREVVFLDAPFHLGEQRFSECCGVGHEGCLIGIFSLKMRSDLRIKGGRVTKDLLPVVCAQPREFVASRMPVAASVQSSWRVAGGSIDGKILFWSMVHDLGED